MKKIVMLACLLLIALSLGTAMSRSSSKPAGVQVQIINSEGQKMGTAQLNQQGDKVVIHLEAENLPPGKHGIHFHNAGKCDTPDFTTAESHFNPHSKQHGFNNPKGFHDGDLPNIEVGADGKAQADIVSENVTLVQGKPNSLLKADGTSLVIHEKEDDYVTDPAGNSGNRIACGVIK